MVEVAHTLDPEDRREVASRVLAVWARIDAPAALQALEAMADPQLTRMAQISLTSAWALSDPLAAFEWVRALPASESRSQVLAMSLGRVALSDPMEAVALAGDLDAGIRSNVIHAVLRQWGRDDPRAAVAWLDASPHRTPSAIAAVVGGYTRLDADEAFDWLLEQSVDAQRGSVSSVVRHVARDSPDAALRLIGRIDDPKARQHAGSTLMHEWVELDPRMAVRAVARLDHDARQELYQDAFSEWAVFDLDKATTFINQIPATGRDAAIKGVMQQVLFDGDTQTAERLFARIVDEDARRHAAAAIYFKLSHTDPKRAERYRKMMDMTIDEDGSMVLRVQPGQH